jgi:hypothetical protein
MRASLASLALAVALALEPRLALAQSTGFGSSSGRPVYTLAPSPTNRRWMTWSSGSTTDGTWTVAPSPVTAYGAGPKSTAASVWPRLGLTFGLTAVANVTNGYITTGFVSQRAFLPKLWTEIKANATANIVQYFGLDTNAGTCGWGGGTPTTANATFACTTETAAIIQDSRTTISGAATHWLCCSGDGTNGSCSELSTVSITSATEWILQVDLSINAQLTCRAQPAAVGATVYTVTKATNLPGATTGLKLNVVATNTAAEAKLGPYIGAVTLEQQW